MRLVLHLLPEEAEAAAAELTALVAARAPFANPHARRALEYLAGVLSHNAAVDDPALAQQHNRRGAEGRVAFTEARATGRIRGPHDPGWRRDARCQIRDPGATEACGDPAAVATPELAACGRHARYLPWGREQVLHDIRHHARPAGAADAS